MNIRKNTSFFILGTVILLLIGAMAWSMLANTANRQEPDSISSPQGTVTPTYNPTAMATMTRASSAIPTRTATPTQTATPLADPRQAGVGDVAAYSSIADKSGIMVESLVLAKKDVLLPNSTGYRPVLGGNILGLMTVRVVNTGPNSLTVPLFQSDLILDDTLVDLWDYGQAGDYSLEIGGETATLDPQGNFQLEPGKTAQVKIWFDLAADTLPRHFTWLVYCPLETRAAPDDPSHIFPQCANGSLATVSMESDLHSAQPGEASLESLAAKGYPNTWPSPAGVAQLLDDSRLPACSGDEFLSIRDALKAYVPEHYRGIIFQANGAYPSSYMIFALTSGETATIPLQRAGHPYTIHLARVYYLSDDDELRSVWLAYGYTDPLVWEQRQGIPDAYNRGFQPFRGDALLWSPEEANRTMQTPGQELVMYLSGWNISSTSADLAQCPWAPGNLYVPDQVACDLALHKEYSAGQNPTNQFTQNEAVPQGWYLINWSINLNGSATIPSEACR